MTNSSSKQEILVFAFLIILIAGSVFFVKSYKKNHSQSNNQKQQEQQEKITRILLYHSDNYTYKITQEDDYFSIKGESDLDCEVVDCEKLDIITQEITDPEIKKEAKDLLEEIFYKKKTNLIEVTNQDLTIDQISSLEIIINSLIEEELTYNIIKEPYKEQIASRGYAIVEEDNKYKVVIAAGEKKTGGYTISVERVIINNNDAAIYVEETSPEPGSTVTQALTYPSVQVDFNRKPEKLNVINNATNAAYIEVPIKKIDYKYNILTSSNNDNYKETGFVVEKNSAGYLITIAMGQKPTDHYSIHIENIEIEKDVAKIYVKEKHPEAIASNVVTYPIARVMFEKNLPKEIHVINIETKVEYNEIKNEE